MRERGLVDAEGTGQATLPARPTAGLVLRADAVGPALAPGTRSTDGNDTTRLPGRAVRARNLHRRATRDCRVMCAAGSA